MRMNKKGVAWWLWIIFVLVVILGIWYFFGSNIADIVTGLDWKNSVPIGEALSVVGDRVWDPVTKVVGWIVGEVPQTW